MLQWELESKANMPPIVRCGLDRWFFGQPHFRGDGISKARKLANVAEPKFESPCGGCPNNVMLLDQQNNGKRNASLIVFCQANRGNRG